MKIKWKLKYKKLKNTSNLFYTSYKKGGRERKGREDEERVYTYFIQIIKKEEKKLKIKKFSLKN